MKETFDYIIVGAGAAGSVVAARLGEDRNRVLVLEAGPSDRSIFVSMPAAGAYVLSDPARTWTFETGPEPGLGGRSFSHVRGKLLGGSGSVNGMVHVRGNPRDFDRWAKDFKLPTWSYAHCLPYFKRLESYKSGEPRYRGKDGPIKISKMKAELEPFQTFLEAGQQAGLPLTEDYNAYRQEGVHAYQANIGAGVRASSSRKYLRPAVNDGKVTIYQEAFVHKIILDGKRAIGVVFEKNGERREVFAEKEVVVCGGAFNSPHILMLSGIGSKADLAVAGVECVVDLPGVGKGIQDHVAVPVKYHAGVSGMSPLARLPLWRKAHVGVQWALCGSGLGASNLWETGAFFKSGPEAEYVNIQHEFLPAVGKLNADGVSVQDGFLYQVCLGLPRSRGQLSLKSADPKILPRIVFNYLSDRDDCRDIVDAVRRTDETIQLSAWDRLRGMPFEPGLYKFAADELLGWIKRNMGTQYHPCSSCRMGFDDMAVVDDQARVHGVESLRVIDASIMPRITNGNLQCPTIMIAEKVSDILRGRAPLEPEPLAYA